MKIVVLDGFAANPGDISWEPIKELGELVVHDRTRPEDIVERAKDADVVLTNKVVLSRGVIDQLPNLKYVSVLATGYNVVDTDAARERGVSVSNVPAYSSRSVAQLVFGLILELALHVGHHSDAVRSGRWASSKDFVFWDYPLVELDGLTMGIIGLGQIGKTVADVAQAFGMRVLGYSRNPKTAYPGVERVGLETLLRESDVVSLHCPLTPETKGLLNAERLSLMKPSAFLINTSRGPVVNEQDLADALNSGSVTGAGVDVLSVEPPTADNPLLSAKNCIITPHIGWATKAARVRLMKITVNNVQSFIGGSPINVVN
jgi:glycerate dehydrogenase